jgi:O-methyltransferase
MPVTEPGAIRSAYQTLRDQEPWSHPNSTISHHRILPFSTLAPWLDDKDFIEIYDKVKLNTLVDIYRCYELWYLAKQLSNIQGSILEVGVWRGGTGAILAKAVEPNGKKVFLADTFEGVVKAGSNDTSYVGGEHADTSEAMVKDLMQSLLLPNYRILTGIFPEETAHLVETPIAMLHCDVDVYSSAKDVVEWCLPRLTVGGVLVFDDYGFLGCEGITLFCQELQERRDFIFVHNINGHAIFIKIA